MEFVALLSTGKGTWGQVAGLLKRGEWEKAILLGSELAKKFKVEGNVEFIQVDLRKGIKELSEEFRSKLTGKLTGTEVAVSVASGSGKEHMALISALIKLPVGIHFVALTKEGVITL